MQEDEKTRALDVAQKMDRRRCIEAEHRHRRGFSKQMDHPTAVT